ncbi:MAG TPA: hypothetical protein VGH76_21460 [Actinomycetospora sp.]|jgi:hypothetical protein|uniref:hypothetical protein n=1 Tax=Actinomycetospora sp. TaxID=1872135 RepID=UPI002F41C91E
MTQTPIYDEVRRSFGRADRSLERRSFRGDDTAGSDRAVRPIMLRGSGGRHRRSGD